MKEYIWATTRQNKLNDMCDQRRLISAWTYAQPDQSSLCAQWVAKGPRFLHADSEDSDQTGRMLRLIWVFAGRTGHFVGFVIRRLIFWQLALAYLRFPYTGMFDTFSRATVSSSMPITMCHEFLQSLDTITSTKSFWFRNAEVILIEQNTNYPVSWP